MSQGYDRETAIKCALRLGSDPEPDESGNLTVWFGIYKSIQLRPLKYFADAKKPAPAEANAGRPSGG